MSNDIRLFQFGNYVRPKLEENKSKNWVLNGKNNEFYQYVIDRFNGSPTNAAIVDSYCNLIYGNGLRSKNVNTSAWINFISKCQPKEVRKIVSDFELFGEASFQVIKAKNKNDLGAIYHIPKQQIVPSLENEEGVIESYWHSKDWSNTQKYPPTPYPAFGTSNENIEIYCIKPYKAGKNYFSDPDYLSALPYAEMEEELANFYINSIKKGLSAGYIISVPDGGTMTPEGKDEFERKIKAKLTGSPNAMSFVLDFRGTEAKIEIIPFPVNDAQHKQWEYLTGESRQQIMTGHKVVSPKLFGIMSEGGLGNNANELDEAEAQLMKRVIQPKQRYITEALEEVLNFFGIVLDLYFVPLTEPVTVQMSEQKKKIDLSEFGEDEDLENYELIECKPVDYEEEDRLELASVSSGTAVPNAKSKWDTDYYIYRYRYAGNANPERQFCKEMMRRNKIYRREDIELMGQKNVNPGFGMHPTPNEPYSIWKYKGGGLLSANFTGGTCKHYWEKLTYRKKGVKIDVNNPKNEPKESRASGIAGIAPHDI
jgi:hypothetical protein